MKHKTINIKAIIKALSVACATSMFMVAVPASATLVEFDLLDHPDGSAGPPTYGLRLDDPDTSATNTFHFDSVTGVFNTDTNTFHVSGTVQHNQTSDFYALESWISLDTPIDVDELLNPTSGFSRLTGHTESLTLSGHGDFSPTEWMGFGVGSEPDADNFRLDTGHRGVGSTTLSGWGWLAPNEDYPNGHVNFQDWLFTMDNGSVVPEPATVALLGMGIAGLAIRQRRRKSE